MRRVLTVAVMAMLAAMGAFSRLRTRALRIRAAMLESIRFEPYPDTVPALRESIAPWRVGPTRR